MDKQIVMFLYNGLGNTKDWNIDTHKSMDEFYNNYTELKEAKQTGRVLYNWIHIKF